MVAAIPAVVVARNDGILVSQNTAARRLMGPGEGKLCWDVVGGLENAEGLPCQANCVARLLAAGLEHTHREPAAGRSVDRWRGFSSIRHRLMSSVEVGSLWGHFGPKSADLPPLLSRSRATCC